MKIRKVKWQNHPVLGNLELDFTRPDGTVYENIVLIGENGSGKTSVMESIGAFLNIGSFDEFEYLEFEANGIVYRALHRDNGQVNPTFFKLQNMADGKERIRRSRRVALDLRIHGIKDTRNTSCGITDLRTHGVWT